MLDRMSLGGSLEILMHVCKMDSGTILACKSAAKVKQDIGSSCRQPVMHIAADKRFPLCSMLTSISH